MAAIMIAAFALLVAGAMINPLLAGAGILVLTLPFLSARSAPTLISQYFLRLLGLVLIGYAFAGRGFAYLGVAPLYIGEFALGFGLVAAAFSGRLGLVMKLPLTWALLAFMCWGAVRTIPYLGIHGVSALRDGVIWGYGGFAILVSAALLRTGWRDRAIQTYGTFSNWLVLCAPIGLALTILADEMIPKMPGSDVSIINVKPGDMAVHLAGAAAFMIVVRGGSRRTGEKGWFHLLDWLWWAVWLIGAVVAGSRNRGGLLAMGVVSLLSMSFRPFGRWWRVAFLAVAGASLAFTLNLEFNLGQSSRTVSVEQLSENLTSIFSNSRSDLSGTKEWRLAWWSDIVGYTVFGEHFWSGKGYGVNLADDDGYQTDGTLRSPHSGHLTILARSGVPGAVLWVVLQFSFAWLLFSSFMRARRNGDESRARIRIWLLGYWSAFMINGAFDVFLEGPQGGIWFWSLMGLGIAELISDRGNIRRTGSSTMPMVH